MYRIARNAITDHYRRAAVRADPIAPDEVARVVMDERDERPAADRELAACLAPLLAACLTTIAERSSSPTFGELTQEEAAGTLGLSTSGMKSRVQRGRRMLRTEIGRCCRVELDARGVLTDATIREGTGMG